MLEFHILEARVLQRCYYSCKQVSGVWLPGVACYSGNVANHRTESMRLLVLAIVVRSGCSRVTGLHSVSLGEPTDILMLWVAKKRYS